MSGRITRYTERKGRVMEKIKVNVTELTEYQNDHWREYAAQTINGKRAMFLINLMGKYKVTHGEQVLYRGLNTFDAIEAWDSI